MILVTVGGVVEYKFTRLFEIIDTLCDEGKLDGTNIIAQLGANTYTPRNYKSFKFMPYDEFKDMLNSADYVITHAGTGTVMTALKAGRKVILFPRLSEYSEHIDNHQLELCDLLVDRGYAMCAKSKEDLIYCISKIETFIPEKIQSNNLKINQLIIKFIENS